jgi:hypothetical protein
MFHVVLDTFPTSKHILSHMLQLCGFMKHLKLNVPLSSSIWIDLIYSMFQYLQERDQMEYCQENRMFINCDL